MQISICWPDRLVYQETRYSSSRLYTINITIIAFLSISVSFDLCGKTGFANIYRVVRILFNWWWVGDPT